MALELLRNAMEEEINSASNCLRSTFLNKIPTAEEIEKVYQTLSEKLCADTYSKNDAKLALMDVIEDSLSGN